METVINDKINPCPCCKACANCTTGFGKVVDLENAGLVIYRHTKTEDVNQDNVTTKGGTKTTEDIFILHNTKDKIISSTDFLTELERRETTCVRCRKKMEHALKLLQKVPALCKNNITGICDRCRLEEQPCNDCNEAVKKFFLSKGEAIKENTKRSIIEWLSKYKNVFKDSFVGKQDTSEAPQRSRSELRMDDLCRRERESRLRCPSTSERKPDIRELLHYLRRPETARTHPITNESINRPLSFDFSGRKTKSAILKWDPIRYMPDKDKVSFKSRDFDYERDIEERRNDAGKDRVSDITRLPKSRPQNLEYSVDDILAAGFSRQYAHDKERKHGVRDRTDEEQYLSHGIFKSDKRRQVALGQSSARKDIAKKLPERTADILLSERKKTTSGGQKTQRLQKQFSYVFPKKSKSRKTLNQNKSSSEIIQHTQGVRSVNLGEDKKRVDEKNKRNGKPTEKTQKIGAKDPKSKQSGFKSESKDRILKEDKENAKTADLDAGRDSKEQKNHKKEIATSATRRSNKAQEKPSKETEKQKKGQEKQGKENAFKTDKTKAQGTDTTSIPITKRKGQTLKKVADPKLNTFFKDDTLKTAKEENALMRKMEREAKDAAKGLDKPSKEQKTKNDIIQMDGKKFKMLRPSQDNLILNLVRLKQDGKQFKEKLSETYDIRNHQQTHHGTKGGRCLMCAHSDMELELDERARKKDLEESEVIRGKKICKLKQQVLDKNIEKEVSPLLFKSKYNEPVQELANEKNRPQLQTGKSTKCSVEPEAKGVIRYALSDRTFIEKGWTMLPTEKVVRKMNVYRMRPAQPKFDWFKRNKNKGLIQYESGERLAEFGDDGRGRWYYKNGRMALDYYDAQESNAQQRYVIYSNGEPDERGRSRPYTVLATFDYLGNGVVFDHGGKIRLKYNQTEGVVLDRNIGPVTHWKWHTLNDPPVLQQVMIDTQVTHKDPEILKMGKNNDPRQSERPNDDQMLAIEFDNFVKEKSKKITQSFKPFQIKMKALKINENFSLKVLDQETIYLIYRDGMTNLKLNIGMILDHKEIIDTDTAELGEVANNLEKFPARTDSLARLQKSVAYAERFERTRTERDRRLRPLDPSISADKLSAAASRPMRSPLRTVHSCSAGAGTTCNCFKYSRKPSSNNVYYNQRVN